MINEDWVKIGETEQIDNDLNPNFQTAIKVLYNSEKKQKLKFVINDVDTGGAHDLIGSRETMIGSILHAKNQTWMERLEFQGSEKHRGIIIVRAENVESSNAVAKFKLNWQNIRETKTCLGMCGGNPGPVRYLIERQIPNTKQFVILQRSYPYKNKTFTSSTEIQFLSDLCSSNKERPIRFAIKNEANTKEICSIETTIA